MGQRAKSGKSLTSTHVDTLNIAIFPTDLGWIGMVGSGQRIVRISIGHVEASEVRQTAGDWAGCDDLVEADWYPELRERIQEYCRGRLVEFDDVELQIGKQTPFQKRVLSATRKIRYGQTLSYGELASKAGFPRAARAVGTVMSSNCFPIIVPCHRVVGSNSLGGYTARRGTCLKEELLNREAETVATVAKPKPAQRSGRKDVSKRELSHH